MTESKDSEPTTGIPDESLPEDLRPSEDNPLAEGLEPGESVDELLTGGKKAEQTDTGTEDSGDADDAGSRVTDGTQPG